MESSIGTLTPFSPQIRPTGKTIWHLENECITKSMEIPNPQAPNLEFAGHLMKLEEYAHTKTHPWIDPP